MGSVGRPRRSELCSTWLDDQLGFTWSHLAAAASDEPLQNPRQGGDGHHLRLPNSGHQIWEQPMVTSAAVIRGRRQSSRRCTRSNASVTSARASLSSDSTARLPRPPCAAAANRCDTRPQDIAGRPWHRSHGVVSWMRLLGAVAGPPPGVRLQLRR